MKAIERFDIDVDGEVLDFDVHEINTEEILRENILAFSRKTVAQKLQWIKESRRRINRFHSFTYRDDNGL